MAVKANLKLLNEKYLSDGLKELLTTNFETKNKIHPYHPFGVKFAEKFVKKVFGQDKLCALQNSSVIREYPVWIKLRRGHTTKYLDLIFLDLDRDENGKDNFVIGIENKFLTEDSENQLSDYYNSLKNIFNADIKIIYLTLDGRRPRYEMYLEEDLKNNLLCMSWIGKDGILGILMKLIYPNKSFEEAIDEFNKDKKTKFVYCSKKKEYQLQEDLIIFIKNLILIKKIYDKLEKKEKNEIPLEVTQFIECLKRKYKKQKGKQYSVEIEKLKNYFVFKHFHYRNSKKITKHKIWVAKNIDADQAAHMIHYFYTKIWEIEQIENLQNCDKEIKNLKNIFYRIFYSLEDEIAAYLSSNKDNK